MCCWKTVVFCLVMLFLSSCRAFPLLIDGRTNRIVVNKDTGWSVLSQRKFYTQKGRYSLQGTQNSFDIFYFEGTSHTAHYASLLSVPSSIVPWEFPYLEFAHRKNELLLNWDFDFSSRRFVATLSTNTFFLGEITFRILEQSASDQWNGLIQFRPQAVSDSTNISLGISPDHQKGVLAYADGMQLYASVFRTVQNSPVQSFRVLPTVPDKFLALRNNAGESIFIYLDAEHILHMKKMRFNSVIAERPIASFGSKNVSLVRDKDEDHIVWIISDENNKLNVQTLNLCTYELMDKIKTPINGSKGILKKDKNGRFYLAFITPENKPRVVTTEDFNSWTQLGAYSISSSIVEDLDLVLLDTTPIVGYVDNSYLYIMIYDNENFAETPLVSVQKPVAVFEKPLAVRERFPFTISGVNSKNYNQNPLTYYWKTDGGEFNNPHSPTPTVTMTKTGIQNIILEVSDGIQLSDPVTNEVYVNDIVADKVKFTVIAKTDLLESTKEWKNIDTTMPLKFSIKEGVDVLGTANILYNTVSKKLCGDFTIPYANSKIRRSTFLVIEDKKGNTLISSVFDNTAPAGLVPDLDSQDTVQVTNILQYSSAISPATGHVNWVLEASTPSSKTIELFIPAKQLYTENFLYDLLDLEIRLVDKVNNQLLHSETITRVADRPEADGFLKAVWMHPIDPSVDLEYRDVRMYISNSRGDELEVSLAFNIARSSSVSEVGNIKITNNGTWKLTQSPNYPYAHLVAKDIGGFNGSYGELFQALPAGYGQVAIAGYSETCGLFFNMLKFRHRSFGNPSVTIITNNHLDPTISSGIGISDLYAYYNEGLDNNDYSYAYTLMYLKTNPKAIELHLKVGPNPKKLKHYPYTYTDPNILGNIIPGSSRILYTRSEGLALPYLVFTYDIFVNGSTFTRQAYIPGFGFRIHSIATEPQIEPLQGSSATPKTSLSGTKARYFVVGCSTNTEGDLYYQNMWVASDNKIIRYTYSKLKVGIHDFVSTQDQIHLFDGAADVNLVYTLDNDRELYIVAYIEKNEERFKLVTVNDEPGLGPLYIRVIPTNGLYKGIPDSATKMLLDTPITNKNMAIVSDVVFHDSEGIPQRYVYVFWVNRYNEVYGARTREHPIALRASQPITDWEQMGRIATHAISIEAYRNEQNRPVLFIKGSSGTVSIYEINLK